MAAQDEPKGPKGSCRDGGEVRAMLPWGELRVREGFAIVMGPTLSAPGGPSHCQILICGGGSIYKVFSQELTTSHVGRAARAFLPSSEKRELVGKEEGPPRPATPVRSNAISFAHSLGLRQRIPSSPRRQSRQNVTGARNPPRLRPLDWLRHETPLPFSELERLREQTELHCRYQLDVRVHKFPIAHKRFPSRYKIPVAHSFPSRCKFPIASIRSVGHQTVSKCKTNLLDGNEALGDMSTDARTSRRMDAPPVRPARPVRLSASAARAAAATANWSHSYTAPRRRTRDGLNFRSRALLKRCRPCFVLLHRLPISSPSSVARASSADSDDEIQAWGSDRHSDGGGCCINDNQESEQSSSSADPIDEFRVPGCDSDDGGCCIDVDQQPEQSSSPADSVDKFRAPGYDRESGDDGCRIDVDQQSEQSSAIAANSPGAATPAENEGVKAAGGDAGLSGNLLQLLSLCKPCVVSLTRVTLPSPPRPTRVTRATRPSRCQTRPTRRQTRASRPRKTCICSF